MFSREGFCQPVWRRVKADVHNRGRGEGEYYWGLRKGTMADDVEDLCGQGIEEAICKIVLPVAFI
jgi:hypothetical protein